jgi:DUF1680 family protein
MGEISALKITRSVIAVSVIYSTWSAATIFAAEPAAMTVAVKDVFEPAPPNSTIITGRLGDKINLCINNRLLQQDVESVVAPYRQKRETGSSDWRCEYWGKWYTSLALADAYRSDTATRSVVGQAATELIKTAAPDGYLGTRQPAYRLQGWDVWGQKYALLGLISGYDRTGDPALLLAARKQTDVLITELGPGRKNIEDVGEWNGLPASSVLEPVVQLYERTGDVKYLDFAKYIVACWQKPSGRLPKGMRLVDDALAGKSPAQMCAPKSYEMMSCFEGLCELYRATGNQDYREAAIKLCEGVNRKECTLIGCGSSGEVWNNGAKLQTGVVEKPMETCVTATWMKLNYQLLRLTGDERYADTLENNLYNGLLGAMMPDGRWWAYFSGLMGVRVPSYVQHDDVGLSCCVVNGPRGLMITPFWAFMTSAQGPVVNLYAPGSAVLPDSTGHTVKLNIDGDYPVDNHVDITVAPVDQKEFTEPFTIWLRVPAWSTNTDVKVGNETFAVTAGTYAKLARRWHAGDRVSITFDMHGRIIDSPAGNGYVAIARGPMVLSLDNRLNPSQPAQLTLDRSRYPEILLTPDLAAAGKIDAWMAFDVPATDGQHAVPLTFCEYAAAGNAFSQKNTFRTWLPAPMNLETVFKTGQTWNTLSHASRWTEPPATAIRVKDGANDLALARNGSTAAADSDYEGGDSSAGKAIDGIISTDANFDTHRWHSSVTTPHPHWIQVTLPKPAPISCAIIDPADPAGYPVKFEGQVRKPGQTDWTTVFQCEKNDSAQPYTAEFQPVESGAFRLVIESSANPKYPNAAQVSEIELYAVKPK